MFATGIENSYPTIRNGSVRIDEMEKCGHYKYWREDFELLRELGVHYLRYGPPIHHVRLGPNRYDWIFPDDTFGMIKALDVVPIADLCHFGVPAWICNIQNPDFPELFADYARSFAKRFPWADFSTARSIFLVQPHRSRVPRGQAAQPHCVSQEVQLFFRSSRIVPAAAVSLRFQT
jgi:beta-glucosidase/6-phospho-beta-glucosidase/beta-galactosidase